MCMALPNLPSTRKGPVVGDFARALVIEGNERTYTLSSRYHPDHG